MTKINFLNYFGHCEKDDVPIAIPNEIFDDFKLCSGFLGFRQQAFAYCYYYLISYLYRNTKYGNTDYLKCGQMELLNALGVSRKRYNGITKKDGVLDSLGYTTSETDFPIGIEWNGKNIDHFIMYYEHLEKDFRKHGNIHPHFTIKKPTKAFVRSVKDLECEGTFFDSYYTHIIDFSVFSKCMEHEKYGFEMFYVYGFLMARSYYINKKTIYRSYVETCLDISKDSLRKYLLCLAESELVELQEHKYFRYKITEKLSLTI